MPCSLFPQKHSRRKPLTSSRKQIWLTGLMMVSKSGKRESGPAKLFALSTSHSSLTRTQARLGLVISCAPHCLLLLPVGKMTSFNSQPTRQMSSYPHPRRIVQMRKLRQSRGQQDIREPEFEPKESNSRAWALTHGTSLPCHFQIRCFFRISSRVLLGMTENRNGHSRWC